MKDGAGPATGRVNDAIRMCDLAVMMGGPAFQHLLHAAIKGLEERLAQEQPGAPQAGEGVGAGAAPPAKRARVSVDAPATNREAAAAAGQGQEEQEGQAVGSDGGATASAACDGSGSPAGLSHHHKSGWATQRAAGGVRLPPGSLVDGPLASRPPVLHVPPLETFLQECMAAPGGGRPTIITGEMGRWWCDTRVGAFGIFACLVIPGQACIGIPAEVMHAASGGQLQDAACTCTR